MSVVLLTCPRRCGWERVAMTPRADAKALAEHAEKCGGKS